METLKYPQEISVLKDSIKAKYIFGSMFTDFKSDITHLTIYILASTNNQVSFETFNIMGSRCCSEKNRMQCKEIYSNF